MKPASAPAKRPGHRHRVRHSTTYQRKPSPLAPMVRPLTAEERAAYLRAREWARFGGPPERRENALR
jgi:hypothetical protein